MDNIFNFLKSSVAEIVSEFEFKELLFRKKNIVIKLGFDPTSDDLHLGHYIILKKLSDFQKCGYSTHIIVGDFTAGIGDPSGKSVARKVIHFNEIKKNYSFYDKIFFKILDKNLTYIYFNSIWFNFIYLSDFIQLVSFITVSRLLERSDFKNRYLNNKPIGVHEFIYPLLQSFDSVFLRTDIEIGGIDQKFNLLLARNLQKIFFQNEQVLIMMPILIGLDGINKMSKSLNNYISLNEDPYDIFCKIMSLPDKLLKDYFIFLSLSNDYFYEKLLEEFKNLMDVKILLAFKIVEFLYDGVLALKSKLRFINRVSNKIFDYDCDIITFNIEFENIFLFSFLLDIKFILSVSDFKRLLKSNAIKVNNKIIFDKNYKLYINNIYFLQCGKKKYMKIFLKKF